MAKANKLVLSKRQSIWKYKEKNADTTIQELAQKFNCTINQARKAVEDGRAGKLTRTKITKNKAIYTEETMNQNPDILLEKQFNIAVAELDADTTLDVESRINLLSKCINIRKTLQSLRLERYIKRADSVLFGIVIRMYEPEASDDRVIEIYKQAVEIYQSEAG